ncbi:hypothetical protein NPA07_05400 [Mycoplasmopsis caviae]|uniref:Uncharacterized protein n=1 Tax=Mycoplasmopsis caviae TaxID=55603 RepID=A0ABY5IYJ0_9BACT|nr:hypothetical protein [Mycoplasmopsis caviae]UUD34771.1 hypothetical protein NPA07_03025 [Mycoplasmopsis caviae]UUD34842.1 hypothetical protein NPA07_03395 [Mycoplasmopsis caviae]UUD34850.1 hypothetical protein NPA07_03440 [Mycoplasmopsis caviae]UUD34906.1 hypothetical protein NPA07_03785 [Mycoplasmopsis caviae]UUD35087.1 hypothetical protein NPA07_04765 [Mycoplasmopsis caviae]
MENLVIKTRFQAVDTGKTTDYEDKKILDLKKFNNIEIDQMPKYQKY